MDSQGKVFHWWKSQNIVKIRTPPMGWMSWTKVWRIFWLIYILIKFQFLCQVDCVSFINQIFVKNDLLLQQRHPFSCISEQLYMVKMFKIEQNTKCVGDLNLLNILIPKDMADRMAEDGYREAGYIFVHIDDCWMERSRDIHGRLVPNRTRFPGGIDGLAQYVS